MVNACYPLQFQKIYFHNINPEGIKIINNTLKFIPLECTKQDLVKASIYLRAVGPP